MRLLLDEMISGRIAQELRARSHDVIAVAERAALRGLADDELLASAGSEQRAVVTYNRDDFIELDRRFRAGELAHAGIVIVNPRRFPQGTTSIGRLIESIESLFESDPDLSSRIHWLD